MFGPTLWHKNTVVCRRSHYCQYPNNMWEFLLVKHVGEGLGIGGDDGMTSFGGSVLDTKVSIK